MGSNRSHPPLVPTLRRGNLILTKAAVNFRLQGATQYVPTPERGNEVGWGVNSYNGEIISSAFLTFHCKTLL